MEAYFGGLPDYLMQLYAFWYRLISWFFVWIIGYNETPVGLCLNWRLQRDTSGSLSELLATRNLAKIH